MNQSSDEHNEKQSQEQYTGPAPKKQSKEANKSKQKKAGKGKNAGKKPKQKQKKQKENKKKVSKSKNKAATNEKDSENVKQYLQKQNRPYSLINIFDNLHGSIKKPNLQIIVDNLEKSGFLSCKQYGKNKIYFLNQKKFQTNQDEIQKITEQLTNAREQSKNLQAQHKQLIDDYKKLQSMKTENELIVEIERLKQQQIKVQQKKQKLLNASDNKISQDIVIKAEKEQDKLRKEIKKFKAIKKSVIASWCEVLEKKHIEVSQIMGIDM